MSKWISVEDSLPDDGSQVLASGWDNGVSGGNRHVVVAVLCENNWFSESGDEEFTYSTHWQELPEPPVE